MVTFALHHNKDLVESVNRMATLNCSNELVNNTIMDMAAGVTFLLDWQVLLLAMVCFNVFLIYFG